MSRITHQNDAISVHELLWSILQRCGTAHGEASSVDPDHDRQRVLASLDWGIQVKIQTVFLP